MFNYSKIATTHTKSNSHSLNTKPIKTYAKHTSLNKHINANASSNKTAIASAMKHYTSNALSKSYCSTNPSYSTYLKYSYYPKYTKSSSLTKHIRHNSSKANVGKSKINTNQSLNMSRHKHMKMNTHDECPSLIMNTSMSVNTTSNDFHKDVIANINKRKQILTIPSKKENPTKLCTEPNNSGGRLSCECSSSVESFVNDLECKLQMKLSQLKSNSKSGKYNIIKSIFDELIQGCSNDVHIQKMQSLLTKMLKGCTEVVFSYANENRVLKEKHELCQNKFLQCDKENIELRKKIKEKHNEIEELKKKVNDLTTSSSKKQEHSHQSNKSTDASSHKHKYSKKEKIDYLNIHNVTDLDALYFSDKVEMNSERECGRMAEKEKEVVVPSLNLKFNYEDVGEHNKLGGGEKGNNGKQGAKKSAYKNKKLTNTKSLGNMQHINVFK